MVRMGGLPPLFDNLSSPMAGVATLKASNSKRVEDYDPGR